MDEDAANRIRLSHECEDLPPCLSVAICEQRSTGGNDGLNWPHCDGLNWPHLCPTGGRLFELIELEREAPEGMGSRVEQFEQIRRDRDREGLSIRGSGGPPRRASPDGEAGAGVAGAAGEALAGEQAGAKLGPYRAVIDEWLLADRDAPPERAARRGGSGGGWLTSMWWCRRGRGPAARLAAQARTGVAGRGGIRAAGPRPGVEAEVDWGEALVVLGGVW